MPPPSWSLEGAAAQLQIDGFTAAVDARRPQRGVAQVAWRGSAPIGGQILGVELFPPETDAEAEPLDVYSRGGDLIAVYPPSPQCAARVEIYWRAVSLVIDREPVPGIDLQVSVQTGLLQTRPRLVVSSSLPCGALRRLNARMDGFSPLGQPSEMPIVLSPGQGPGCLLMRWPERDASYAEMIGPSDFRRGAIQSISPQRLRLSHFLFDDPLEKGVIWRARLRAVCLPREGDERLAAAAYREFLAAAPPLTA